MELVILGSGTGFISLKRGSPGFLLKTKRGLFLIDSGAGTLTRVLQAGFKLDEIDAIFYTHIHPDHVTDLVPLLFCYKYGGEARKRPLTIFGGPGFKKFFRELSKVYRGWLVPRTYGLQIREVKNHRFGLGGIRVLTCRTNHISESVGFRFEERGRSIVFSGDTDFSGPLARLALGASLFLLECSFPDSMKVAGHLSPKGVGFMAGLARPEKLVLTHFYPPCDRVDILKSVRRFYSGKVVLGRDRMRLKV